jgi:hypothetical protein
LMWAFVVLRNGLPRMSDTFESGCMLKVPCLVLAN